MTEITDDYMREMLPTTREYSVVILRKSHAYTLPGAEKIMWEHGRRNFALRAEGILSIVCRPGRKRGERRRYFQRHSGRDQEGHG